MRRCARVGPDYRSRKRERDCAQRPRIRPRFPAQAVYRTPSGHAALSSVEPMPGTRPVGMSGGLMQTEGRFDAPKSPIAGDPPVRNTPQPNGPLMPVCVRYF